MLRKMLFLNSTFVGLLLISGMSYAFDWAVEAEMAAHVEPPMAIAEDAKASRGKFIWAEGKPAESSGKDHQGWAEYKVKLPKAGTYALWGKVMAWDGNSDSFWVSWRPADPDEQPQKTQNTQFRWGVAQGNDWHWDRINHWLDGGTFDRKWDLPAGESTLIIYTREDATRLDVIFVTDNLAADEAGAKPRDPTDADLVAVEPRGKLTITWAQIKVQ